ncbi:MAG: hypothetical protein EOS34_17435 [Mesorhizobium sp.]|nr:MAG: hypothetical protein EOS34_17435 [Mesorhizobium sp.]
MLNFYVAKMRGDDVKAVAAVHARSDILAALAGSDKPIKPGRKPKDPDAPWVLVTHIASGRTSEFLFA